MRKGTSVFDEIFDLFDRNRGERRNGSRPGRFGRLFGGGDHDRGDDDREPSEGERRRYEGDDDRNRPRRRRDDFGFDD